MKKPDLFSVFQKGLSVQEPDDEAEGKKACVVEHHFPDRRTSGDDDVPWKALRKPAQEAEQIEQVSARPACQAGRGQEKGTKWNQQAGKNADCSEEHHQTHGRKDNEADEDSVWCCLIVKPEDAR